MGSLIIERVAWQGQHSGEEHVVRVSGRLALHIGRLEKANALLAHTFACTPAPELARAAVDFVLNGAAYQWRCDLSMGTCELWNRSGGKRFTDAAQIAAIFDRELGPDRRFRAAAFTVPELDLAPMSKPVPTRATGDMPSSRDLAEQLARYEASLRRSAHAQETASALYGDLFPLLESMEGASQKLELRVRQLERHKEAEVTLAEYRLLEGKLQERLEVGRKAAQLEKSIAEWAHKESEIARIPESTVTRGNVLEAEVETAREAYIAADKTRKEAFSRATAVRPQRAWIAALSGLSSSALALLLRTVVSDHGGIPYLLYAAGIGIAFMIAGAVVAVTQHSRRSSLRRVHRQCKDASAEAKRGLEMAELALAQHLHPFGAADMRDLTRRADNASQWYRQYEAMQEELASLRRLSGTDDGVGALSSTESTQLAALQERCRELSHLRLNDADREHLEKAIEDLEVEARYQKKAAEVLQKQCEELAAGWSGLAENVEKVSELRTRLAEWQRWEAAFKRMREVVDHLPNVPENVQAPVESEASAYLSRLTAGRWSELRFDPITAEFRLFDGQTGLWIRADHENPAVRVVVDLALRLSILNEPNVSARLPLWIEEPFSDLPEKMANSVAEVLAEVSRQRQVVMICRERPRVRWPEGAGVQG